MIIPTMNYFEMLFLFPATLCNIMNSKIQDSPSTTFVVHNMSQQDKTIIVTEKVLFPSPLCIYIDHVFDANDLATTLIAYESCR